MAGQGKLGVPSGIMGLKPAGGRVEFKGEDLPLNDPAVVLKKGVAFFSDDRRGACLLLVESIQMNIGFTAMQINSEPL